MCTPFLESISPLFSNTEYQIRALFLKPVAKKEMLQSGGVFYVLDYTFRRFFLSFRGFLQENFSEGS